MPAKELTRSQNKSRPTTDAAKENGMIAVLNDILADELTLFMKTLNYHWNVEGPQFSEIHKFLDTQYRELLESADLVAEQIRALGGRPLGSATEVLEKAHLTETRGKRLSAHEMLSDLERDHQKLIQSLSEAASKANETDDFGSNDLLAGLVREYQKRAWMLKAYTQH